MAVINYHIGVENSEVFLKLTPALLDSESLYRIENPFGESARPTRFFTGTSDIRDCIGNITKLETAKNGDRMAEVRGVFRGKMRTLRNVKVRDPKVVKKGQRVMVTEHVNVAGGFDLLASTKRLLDMRQPDLTFVNIGWEMGSRRIFLRIDPYTGESKKFEE